MTVAQAVEIVQEAVQVAQEGAWKRGSGFADVIGVDWGDSDVISVHMPIVRREESPGCYVGQAEVAGSRVQVVVGSGVRVDWKKGEWLPNVIRVEQAGGWKVSGP